MDIATLIENSARDSSTRCNNQKVFNITGLMEGIKKVTELLGVLNKPFIKIMKVWTHKTIPDTKQEPEFFSIVTVPVRRGNYAPNEWIVQETRASYISIRHSVRQERKVKLVTAVQFMSHLISCNFIALS